MDEQNLRPYSAENNRDDVRIYGKENTEGTRVFGAVKEPEQQTVVFGTVKEPEQQTMVYGASFTEAARQAAQQQNEARRVVRDQTGPTRSGHYMPDIRSEEKRLADDKKEHKRRDRIKRRKNRHVFTLMWLLMVVLMSLTISSYLITGSNDFFAVDRVKATITVEIPEEVTLDELTEILYEKNVINRPEFFKLYCGLTADMEYFREGTFELRTDLDYEGIINFLQSEGERAEVRVMFYEGSNILDVAELLEENGVCDADEFLNAANEMDFSQYWAISNVDSFEGVFYKLEGYLFPSTYDFYLNEDVDTVIGKMIYAMQQTMNAEDMREAIDASGYTYREIMTIASIIQAEAANTQDMYVISAVLHNRLEDGAYRDIYVLGCDSTTYYPYKRAEDLPAGMENYISPYDTYTIEGLPAGPICSPGKDALLAALNPNQDYDGYYYFGHHDDGTPYYSKTLAEHEYQRDNG